MKTSKLLLLGSLLASSLAACAPPRKTLIGQTFIGEDRSFKILMSAPRGDSEDPVIDQFIRVCTLRDGKETDCKDTMVLENVRPGSLY